MSTNSGNRFKKALIASILVVLISVYFSSYVAVRNRGLREMPQLGVEGILLDSVERIVRTQDLSRHHFRATIYAPLIFIDGLVLGTPGPIKGIMFELS